MRDWFDVLDGWAYPVGLLAGVVLWFARLEARGKRNTENLQTESAERSRRITELEHRIDQQRAEDHHQREAQRKEDLTERHRDRDDMNKRLDVIQSDIKTILRERNND